MRIGNDGSLHLAYCTKIHPANGWQELFDSLRTYLPALKSRVASAQPLGIALRLSAEECTQLLIPARMEIFQDFLAREGCYVFTMNGFPFGSFHGQPVKAKIFAPDWRAEERLQYTLQLIKILQQLLPPGLEGSISTLPLSYKPWLTPIQEETAKAGMVQNLLVIVETLVAIRRNHGQYIHLDIEPEPDGLVEDVRGFLHFYEQWLLSFGAPLLAKKLRVTLPLARSYLLEHVKLCLDTCHLAVTYEEPAEILELLAQSGVGVGKVQIASGLKVPLREIMDRRADLAPCLAGFAASPYLHQVIGRRGGVMASRFADLSQALPHLEGCQDDEWRIHYHMPLFVEKYQRLQTTQAETGRLLQLLKDRAFTQHLEIETYTWEQLPTALKAPLLDSLCQEYHWVIANMAGGGNILNFP